jgi:hypothetical protein
MRVEPAVKTKSALRTDQDMHALPRAAGAVSKSCKWGVGLRASGRWMLLFPLLLPVACTEPRVVDDADAVYCEKQGLPRGSDVNVRCALDRRKEQEEAGIERPAPQHAPMAPGFVEPPSRPGGILQIFAKTVPPEATTTIDFIVSLDAECKAGDVPVVAITKQPAHGILKLTPRTDYRRVSLGSIPPACSGAKVAGIAVEYTPNKTYQGLDSIGFTATDHKKLDGIFRVDLTVQAIVEDVKELN